MQRYNTVLFVAALAVSMAATAGAQSGYDLLQQGLVQERVDGDLQAAITLYARVVEEHTSDRSLVATALLQMGKAFEQLGKPEASDVYRRLITEYDDQRAESGVARRRLAALEARRSTAVEQGIVARQIWAPAGSGVDINALSPDGRYLTFVNWTPSLGGDSSLPGHADLAVYDLVESRGRLVTSRPSQYESDLYVRNGAIWSPDGGQIAYTIWNETWDHIEVHLIGVDGSNDRIIYANSEMPQITPTSWSPDGEFLVCLVQGWDQLRRIGILSLDDGELRILKTFGKHNPWPLDISPDGRYITYDYWQSDESQMHDVFVIATDGSEEFRLTTHAADDSRPFWTPDGERIVFRSDRSGRSSLWSVAFANGRALGPPELVISDVGAMVNLGFSEDGSLYYRIPITVRDVYTAELNLSPMVMEMTRPVLVTDRFIGTNGEAAWSPEGTRLAFLSRRGAGGSGDPHAVVRDLATGEERDYPLPFDLFRYSYPEWSPDGSYLRIESGASGNFREERTTYRLYLNSGRVEAEPERRPVVGLVGRFLFSTVRQDRELSRMGVRVMGQRVADYLEDSNNDSVTERLLTVGPTIERWVPGEGFVPPALVGHTHSMHLSPDARYVAVAIASDTTRETSDLLLLISTADGATRELLQVDEGLEIVGVHWMPEGRSLIYTVLDTETNELLGLWHLSLDGGESRPIRIAEGMELADFGRHMQFDPDGSRVALTRSSRHDEIWVMEGFSWSRASRD